MKKRIAVFASGGGTDFQSVIDANEKEGFCEICLLIASKDGIGAIDRAKKHGIQTEVFSKNDYRDSEELYSALSYLLNMHRVDYVVLAGWLKIIPASFIATFRDRIINIHPSLIPSFCGAGFYGMKVHRFRAVQCTSWTRCPTAALLSRSARSLFRTTIRRKVCNRKF